jgi:hypothetical protein
MIDLTESEHRALEAKEAAEIAALLEMSKKDAVK